MNKNEWSLVGFTLLTQASVGISCIFLFLVLIFPTSFPATETGFSPFSPDFIALLLLAASSILSFLHLGKPQHTPHVFNNLKSSWLSREIAGLILYGFALLVLVFVRITGGQNETLVREILVFVVIMGLLLLFFMSKIYMIRTIPSWNSSFTWQSFYLSSFVLGSLVILIVNGFSSNISIEIQHSQAIILSGNLMMLLVFESISLLSWYLHLNGLKTGSPLQPDFNHSHFLFPLALRALMVIFALFTSILVFYSLQKNVLQSVNLLWLLMVLFLFIVAEQIVGRWMFYRSYFRFGV